MSEVDIYKAIAKKMSEERLKDIQDNINERNMFPNRMWVFREYINDEEQELVNEIERLNNTIEKAVEYIKEHKKEITKTQANIFNEDRKDKSKLKVGTFMWGVDKLLNILNGDKNE